MLVAYNFCHVLNLSGVLSCRYRSISGRYVPTVLELVLVGHLLVIGP